MSRYIDADALLEKVQFRVMINDDTDKTIKRCVEVTRNLIENAPTADVAPVVHGHWEHIAYDKYRCSVCKRETTVDTWLGEPLYKGCPYCFAIMDEKDGKADGTI